MLTGRRFVGLRKLDGSGELPGMHLARFGTDERDRLPSRGAMLVVIGCKFN